HGPGTRTHDIEQFADFDFQVPRFGDQSVGALSEDLQPFRAFERRTVVRDVRSRTVTFGHDAGALEFGVGARDRVRVDDELLGQGADGRRLFARPKPAG